MSRSNADKGIILFTARSGSTLLQKALATRDDYKAVGEVLAEEGRYMPPSCWPILKTFGIDNPQAARLPVHSELLRRLAVPAYLERALQHCDLCKIQLMQLPYDLTLRWLVDSGFRFVRLLRRDLLAMFVSWQHAVKTRLWFATEESPPPATQEIELDPDLFRGFMLTETIQRLRVQYLLHDAKLLDIAYEDMVDQWDAKLDEIQQFLGLSPRKLPKLLVRTVPDIKPAVPQLHAFRQQFIGTALEPYFYVLSKDWFSGYIPRWKANLGNRIGQPLKYLEIGSFEGRSIIWMLNHAMTHPESSAVAVEPGYSAGLNILKRNLLWYPNVKIVEQSSEQLNSWQETEQYDFIYVDGDHREFAVYRDGSNAIRLVKKGGLICFDDYYFPRITTDGSRPKEAIDRLIQEHPELEVVDEYYQLWVRKKP